MSPDIRSLVKCKELLQTRVWWGPFSRRKPLGTTSAQAGERLWKTSRLRASVPKKTRIVDYRIM
eukprot:6348787-Pyramimonas_sp.AAC.1